MFPGTGGIVTGLTLFGKACATIGFSSMSVYMPELFPTDVRYVAVGACSVFSCVSGMVAPFVGGPLVRMATCLYRFKV